MNESALPVKERVESRDSREIILAVALKLFTQKGYDGTSIDDIRAGAGFKSKASLYTHFKSKECVAQALMSRILEQLELVIVQSNDISEPLTRFTNVIRGLIEWSNSHPIECIFHMIQGQKHLYSDELLSKQLSAAEVMLLDIMQQLRAHYPVRPVATEALLSMIFVILAQAVLDGKAFGDINFDEKVEQIISICFGVVFSEVVHLVPVTKASLTQI